MDDIPQEDRDGHTLWVRAARPGIVCTSSCKSEFWQQNQQTLVDNEPCQKTDGLGWCPFTMCKKFQLMFLKCGFHHNVTRLFKQNMPLSIKFEQAKQIWKCALVLSNFPDVADLHDIFSNPQDMADWWCKLLN